MKPANLAKIVRPGPQARVWALNGFLALGAGLVVLAVAGRPALVAAPTIVAWAPIAVMFGAAEVWVVHIQFRRESHTISLSEIPLTLGLFFLPPPALIAAQLVGAAPVLLLHRRQEPLKLVFNLAQFALCAGIAALVFQVAASHSQPIGPQNWLVALLATTIACVLGLLTVSAAISFSEGRVSLRKWLPVLAFSLAGTVVNTSLALIGAVVTFNDTRAGVLLMVPAAALYLAYRAYNSERQKTARMEFLYNSGRTLAQGSATETGIVDLLRQALTQFGAGVAEVTINTGSTGYRTTVRGDEVELEQPLEPARVDEVLEGVMARGKGLIVDRATEDQAERAFLASRSVSDAMVTSLTAENRIIGTILVGNRLGVFTGFTSGDLDLLATLATQVGVALENSRLERTLRHQAFHDSLTDLPNRAQFSRSVEEALAQPAQRVAILLVDLDDFKVVNDTMGHTVGDQLLMTVAERLTRVLRSGDIAARLGGDEFAVLIQDIEGVGDATVAAERFLAVFKEPFSLAGQRVGLSATIGIAADMTGQLDGGSLLLQADVAMYAAKRSNSGGFKVFEPSMQDEVTERHQLREDLRLALRNGELGNYYQPLVSLGDGGVAGAEALVRWHHPQRGLVAPGYFIRIAEDSGLIIELGREVLRQACAEARRWQRQRGPDAAIPVSVNLSAVQLRQPGFVDDVVTILRETGLDPRLLTLEVTESTFMDDTRTVITRLRELRGLGVRLELDDFGTGFSSLSILRDLPLDGLKIDKSFVDGIEAASDRPAFLRAIVRLAQSLDLEMIAEGIETEAQREALTAMGCQTGQGYLFAKPLPPEAMRAFLGDGAAAAAEPQVIAMPRRARLDID